MKKIFIITCLLLLSLSSSAWGQETELSPDTIIRDQIRQLDTDQLQEIMEAVNQDLSEYLPRIDVKNWILKLIRGEEVFTLSQLLKTALAFLFREVVANWRLMGQIVMLAIIYAILANLQSAFEGEAVGKLAYGVCYLVILTLTTKSFLIAIDLAGGTIDGMVSFMQALMPVLMTLLIAMGGLTSAAFFQPILVGAIGFIGTFVKTVILPLILFSAVLGMVNGFSDKIQISKLAGFLRQTAALLLGFILTAFVGVISIQGITAGSADGVTIRTAKFAVDKLVPVVGKFLSDAMDTVLGCSLLIKNAVGAVGLFSIFMICLVPLLKIIALIVIYKVSGALIEPVAPGQLPNCLNEIGQALVLLFATVSSVAIMFFITITVIVGTGNITLMMR